MLNKNLNLRGPVMLVSVIVIAAAILSKKNSADNIEKAAAKQYVCSMHPQVIRNEQGDCPICGMLLIELVEHDKNSYDSSLADVVLPVTGSVQGNARTVTAGQAELPVVIEASGIVYFDPAGIRTISARFGGYVEKSFVRYQYQHIKKGQKIFEIYSPDIYAEKWNYVKLIQAFPDRDDVTAEALEWFGLLGLSKGQIDSLKRSQIPDYHLAVYCDGEGYAVSRDFEPDSYGNWGYNASGTSGFTGGVVVQKGDPLFKLIDARAVRIDLRVKADYAPLVDRGQYVIIADPDDPGKQYRAVTELVEPFNKGFFQTVRVCFRIPANENPMQYGKKIKARIFAGSHRGLWLPVSAVAETGRHCIVYVRNGNRFEAVEVRTGMRLENRIEILHGIEEGSEVAEKALLLMDSDSFISMK